MRSARVTRLVLACAAALLLGATSACVSQEGRAEQARAALRQAIERGDLDAIRAALAQLRSAGGSDTPESLLELARYMQHFGEAPEAVWLLERGSEQFPERVDVRLALAQLALETGDAARARALAAKVQAGAPEHLAALVIQARADLGLGNLDAALATLASAARLYPERPEAPLARASALLEEERFEEAERELAAARARAAGTPQARNVEYLAAALRAAQGDAAGAVRGLEAAVAASPEDAGLLRLLLLGLIQLERSEEAVARVEREVAARPAQPELRVLQTEILTAAGRLADAASAARQYAAQAPSPSAYALLGRVLAAAGDWPAAATAYAEGAQRYPETPRLRMQQAEALIEAGELEAAAAASEAFAALASADPHVDYLRGRLALARGDAAGAREDLARAVSRLDTPYTQLWLGVAAERAGDPVEADRRYLLAAQRGGGAPALEARLRLAEREGSWIAVAETSRQLLQLQPDGSQHALRLAGALLRAGVPRDAELVARELVKRAPDVPEPHALLAAALLGLDRLDEATAALDAAEARLGPQAAFAAERARVLARRGRSQQALEQLERAIAKEPQRASYHSELGVLRLVGGDVEGGMAALDRALELEPGDPEPLKIRTRFWAAHGNADAALADGARYLAARPRDASVHFMLGAVQDQAGRAEAAIESYRRAIALDPQQFAARNNLALRLASLERWDEALAEAQAAYALAGENAEVVDTLGWLYLKRGLAARAVALLERARALDGAAPEPVLHLALAYRDVGRTQEARALLERLAAELETGSPLRAEVADALRPLAN